MKNVALFERYVEEEYKLYQICDADEDGDYEELKMRLSACVDLIIAGGIPDDIIAVMYDTALATACQFKVLNNDPDVAKQVSAITCLIDELYWDRYRTTEDPKE